MASAAGGGVEETVGSCWAGAAALAASSISVAVAERGALAPVGCSVAEADGCVSALTDGTKFWFVAVADEPCSSFAGCSGAEAELTVCAGLKAARLNISNRGASRFIQSRTNEEKRAAPRTDTIAPTDSQL